VDLDDLVGGYSSAVSLCREVGRAVRKELGGALQPALGWDSSKFTAQAAARCMMRPGHLRAISAAKERGFLQPLPITLLPLMTDVLQRLNFLGLRTLGQYAALPPGAVWQQFGRAGKLAYRCARGEDDRPVIPRFQAPHVVAAVELESPLIERERLMAELQRLVSPMLAELRANLRACGQVRLTVQFDNGTAQEATRIFVFPLAQEGRILRILGKLLDGLSWRGSATGLGVELDQVQDLVPEQLTLFPLENKSREKLGEIQRYLAARFDHVPPPSPQASAVCGQSGLHYPRGNGFEGSRLRRAVMTQPGAPLPEWRISWQTGDRP
jgi:nucleotidyltransferase/DNA polymerase involved in DNA repair